MTEANTITLAPFDGIDREAIRVADAARDATHAANREAQKAFDAAKATLAAAVAMADAAAATGTGLLEAETAVQAAELSVRAAERRAKATAAAAADAPREHRAAVGRAHRGAAFDAIERRIAACAAAEEADRAKQAAESALALATADLHRFVNLGCQIRGGLDAAQYLRSEADERKYWAANNVDIAKRLFYPGEKA
jgi:hypothetical protein